MLGRFRFFRRLFIELPQQLRLAYCLIRDPRVPATHKAAFGGGLVISLLPQVSTPKRIPLLGDIDSLALALLATRLFIQSCPDEVVIDLEQQIIEQRSVFDADVRHGEDIVLSVIGRFRGETEHDVFGIAARDAATAPAAGYAE
jgi:hypothetical protein